MKIIDNPKDETLDKTAKWLYTSHMGNKVLNLLIKPRISKTAGAFMDSSLSRFLVKPVVKRCGIDMSQCEKAHFYSFNDFFTRKLIKGSRPFSENKENFISPCDGYLSVFAVDNESGTFFDVKHSPYTVTSLLRDGKLARRYRGGYLWIFRLSVEDYHRYIYTLSGKQSKVRHIDGVYHTVNPTAFRNRNIYRENTREYCLINTESMGTVLCMEVGAMMVGKIVNFHKGRCQVCRGREKGHFAYGGSTIIMLTEKGRVVPCDEVMQASRASCEVKVTQGETVGHEGLL